MRVCEAKPSGSAQPWQLLQAPRASLPPSQQDQGSKPGSAKVYKNKESRFKAFATRLVV